MEPTQPLTPDPAKPAIYSPRVVLAFSMLFSALRGGTSGIAVGTGYAGGYFLNHYYLQKHVPDEASYPRRSWVKPLIIWLVVSAILVGGMVVLVMKGV